MAAKDKAGEKPATEVAVRKDTALVNAGINMEEDRGGGMEGTDKDSFAIPFISVLQGLSPALQTVEGAKIGMLINTVTNELYESIRVIPCAFQRRYLKWLPRSKGGGYKGEMTVAEFETLQVEQKLGVNAKGIPTLKEGQNSEGEPITLEVKDTRNHFVLIVHDDGTVQPGHHFVRLYADQAQQEVVGAHGIDPDSQCKRQAVQPADVLSHLQDHHGRRKQFRGLLVLLRPGVG